MDAELAMAALQVLASKGPGFDINTFCFEPQLDLIKDPAKFKTGVCSRRSGKTVACAADLVATALDHPRTVSL